jgi:thiol-disulfide isomerase/thioredoxin
MDIFTRSLITFFLIAAGIGLYWLANRVILARVRGRKLGLESLRPGIPAILYFTSPTCAPCKTVQRPELARLQEQLGERLQIIQVDCTERPDLAEYWGVLSVPTTFIIDAKGRPRGVNHGVTWAAKLLKQLEEVNGKKIAGNWVISNS